MDREARGRGAGGAISRARRDRVTSIAAIERTSWTSVAQRNRYAGSVGDGGGSAMQSAPASRVSKTTALSRGSTTAEIITIGVGKRAMIARVAA